MFRDAKAFSSFSTNDIGTCLSFYKDILGLDVEQTPEGLSIRLAFGGNVFIYPKPDHTPATFTVLNFHVDDLERTLVDLNALGVHAEQYDMGEFKTDERGIVESPAGQGPRAMAWIKDPTGNVIGLMQEK